MTWSSNVAQQVAKACEEHDSLDPSTLAVTLTLYRTMAAFERASMYELAPYGLTTSQFNILTVLHRAEGPMTMGRLGRAVAVRPANLTSLVDSLTTKDLVERQPNADDRRSYLVTNTPAGEEFLSGFLPRHWEYLERLTGRLAPDERAQLADLLTTLMESAMDVVEEDAVRKSSESA